MSAPTFPFVPAAARALTLLQASLTSPTSFEYLLEEIGWEASFDFSDLAPLNTTLGLATDLQAVAALVADLGQQRGDVVATVENLVSAAESLFKKLTALQTAPSVALSIAPFDQAAFWPALARDLAPYLLTTALQEVSPVAYTLLFLTGVIQETEELPTAAEASMGRLPYTRISLHWGALGDFLSNPVQVLSDRYQWGAGRVLDYQRVLGELQRLLQLFPVRARLSLPPAAVADRYYTDGELASQRLKSLILPFISGLYPDGSGSAELGLSITPIPAPTAGGVALSHTPPAGFLLAPYLHGTEERSIALRSDLRLEFKGAFASDNAIGLEVLPGAVQLESEPGSTIFAAAVNLVGAPATPLRLFGTDKTSRLELTGYALSVGAAGTVASPELLVRAGTALAGGPGRLVLYLEPGDGDSFMAQAFGPDPIKLEVGGALTWSSRTGLGIDGAVGLHIRRAPNKTIGPLTLHDYSLDIDGQTGSQGSKPLTASLTLGGSLRLGPVTATVEKIGVILQLSTLAGTQKGLLDNLAVQWGFKGPSGVGIEVDSDIVSGGGYLFLDPDKHTYAGAANLQIKAGTTNLNVNALGILQTELPGYPDDYSLLLLLTATFGPLDLGLGFTLKGLGGLLGVNRQSDVDYLRGMVRQGQLRKLLFADDVMTDPTAALALVDAAFPVARGRYVIGLMAELGWGSVANLITLDAALLVELPKPVRVLLLGVLEVVLPGKQKDQPGKQIDKLKLRAEFLGVVDFGAKKVSFDAALSDSNILDFTLTGDLAFRLYQGDNPLFVITAGGFHPSFQPPAGAGLTGLKRLTLALNKGDLRMTLASYFAVTSNTVQFGSHLDLVYNIGHGFRVEGHFGFDVLFQFSPFHLLAHVEAGVAIKRGDSEYLSVHLALDVTGPGPWHVWGEASFRVLCFKISFNVNATIGSTPTETSLPAPNVHEQLLAALRTPASWQVEASATAALPGGVVLRPVVSSAGAGQVFLDPRGALSLHQRVAPLGLQLEKYGSAVTTPTGGRFFEISQLQVGAATYALGGKDSLLQETRDFFAPDQFLRLTDAQKLSSPSFERLANGVRLSQLNGLVVAPHATRRVVEYEKKLLSGASGGSVSTTTAGQAIGAATYRRLAQGSTLGRAVQQAQPSARAAQPVAWGEDTYEVVYAESLDLYDPAVASHAGHEKFKTQAEATQYCQSLVATDAALELLVVPTYQLALA
ncbi:hypothetical protein GCM10027422_48680 [Hymenobacter arcticus]